MYPFGGGIPHCKQCGCELEGGEEACPYCKFNPRLKGLRVAMGLLGVFVISMTTIMMLIPFWTGAAPLLLSIGLVSFALALVVFLFSFLATPYRFGWVFTRF